MKDGSTTRTRPAFAARMTNPPAAGQALAR